MTTRETVASSGVTVPSHAPRTLVIVAGRRSWLADWRELLAFRELLWVLTARDVTVRYKQTVLGTAWAVLRPLTAMIIFSVTFGRLAKLPSDGLPYPLFVYAGLLPWTFFSTAVANSGQSLVGSTALVSKIYFPRVIIPLSSIGASLVDMLISMVILVLMMLWYGVGMHANLLAIPIALGAAAITAVSFGILLAALTVSYRDFTHITPFLLQVWMYATPVVFPMSLVPARWQLLLFLNPATGLVEVFRSTFLGRPCDVSGLLVSSVVTSLTLVAALTYFVRVERRFADVI